ncbi:MAG: hypothetical protein IPN92_16045 [Chromatiaceae bacterium]|nr:hypothetical protein [Chromatiaceae bacterium]
MAEGHRPRRDAGALGDLHADSGDPPVPGPLYPPPQRSPHRQASGANLADAQGQGQGQGTILNDDGPVLSIADVTLAEGHSGTQNALFKVSLTPASSGAVTVRYATANGTAQAGSDYTATSGVLTLPAGQLVRTVSVAVRGERIKEGNETFFVNLREPSRWPSLRHHLSGSSSKLSP